MDRSKRRELKEIVDRWCEDPDRVRTVDARLKAVGLGISNVITVLRDMGERVVGELSDVEPTELEQELNRRLDDLINHMVSGLRDLRVIEPDRTYRREPAHAAKVSRDVSPDAPQEMDDLNRGAMAIMRTLLESHAMRLAGNREWVAAGILNRLNLGTLKTVPTDVRLPRPRQGATPDQARMWPALWLAGRRDVFPRHPGRDPRRVLRGQLLRQLHHSWNGFLSLARDNDALVEDNRGN